MASAADTHDGTVVGTYVAPDEHPFYLVPESESFEAMTGLLGPPVLRDHTADFVPVTTIDGAMEATGVE